MCRGIAQMLPHSKTEKNMPHTIPEKAQRVINRSLDDLIPTNERSPKTCDAIRKEVAITLYELQEGKDKINYNNLSSTFFDLSNGYAHGTAKHEFYGGLAASIGVLTGQDGRRYEPRALRAGRDQQYTLTKERKDSETE